VIVCIDTLRMDPERWEASASTPELSLDGRRDHLVAGAGTSNWTVPAVGSTHRPTSGRARTIVPRPEEPRSRAEGPERPRSGVPAPLGILQGAAFTALFSGNPYLYGRFQAGFASCASRRGGVSGFRRSSRGSIA
jgi:hypothetical protein